MKTEFKKIVVTGCHGFIGSSLVESLLDLVPGECLTLCDLKEKPLLGVPVLSPSRLLSEFRSGKYHHLNSHVIHLGAHSSPSISKSLAGENLEFSLRLLDICQNYSIPLIYASSAAVYGQGENSFSDSASLEPLCPLNDYARSKLDFDKTVLRVLKNTATPLSIIGLRFFNVFGFNEILKESSSRTFIFNTMFSGLKNPKGEIKIFGDIPGSQYPSGYEKRDYVYIKTVLRVIHSLLWRGFPPSKSGIYNIGSGNAISFEDIFRFLQKRFFPELSVKYVPLPDHLHGKYQDFTCSHVDKTRDRFANDPLVFPYCTSFEEELEDLFLRLSFHIRLSEKTLTVQ